MVNAPSMPPRNGVASKNRMTLTPMMMAISEYLQYCSLILSIGYLLSCITNTLSRSERGGS